jgi:tripartite-type tricarboxylate transporter receptor subunit TctC
LFPKATNDKNNNHHPEENAVIRKSLTMAAALVAATTFAAPGQAQEWPQSTIRLLIAFGPGGGTDIVGRILAQRMQEKLGQSVVVENRPGAGGVIGNEAVARAAKDGYTLGIMTAGQTIAAVLRKSMPYDQLKAFDSIGMIAAAGFVIVTRSDFPGDTVKDLIAAAKANPGKLTVAAPGFGATQHMAAALFNQTAGINVVNVPFRTTPEAVGALMGKQVDVLFDTVPGVLGQIQSGQLKAIAVTGKDRSPAVPKVPSVIESGAVPGYDVTTWYGFFGPRGMPPAVIAKLNKTLNEILAEPGVRERMVKAGVDVHTSTPDGFAKHMADEFARWNKVREAAGMAQQ